MQAVPCEAFCEALCAANPDQDSLLQRMLPWYNTTGTPELTVSTSYSPSSESLTITIKQRNDTAKEVDKALNKPGSVSE
jgi:aminopeptidase N